MLVTVCRRLAARSAFREATVSWKGCAKGDEGGREGREQVSNEYAVSVRELGVGESKFSWIWGACGIHASEHSMCSLAQCGMTSQVPMTPGPVRHDAGL